MKLFESLQENLSPALQFWLRPMLLMLFASLGLHALLLGLPLRTEPKPEEEPEPEPTETVEITSLIAEPSSPSSPKPSPAPKTPPPQPTPPQLQPPPPPRPRQRPPIVQTPREKRAPEPTPAQQQPTPSPQLSPQPSPEPLTQTTPTPSPDNSAATAAAGSGLLDELYKRVYRDLTENSTNTPEAVEASLKGLPYEQIEAEKRSYFFTEPTQLKPEVIGSLGITQRTPSTAYDKYIQPILTNELGFDVNFVSRYGEADLFKAENDNRIEFYMSLVPYGSFGSQTFVVIWPKDPREL